MSLVTTLSIDSSGHFSLLEFSSFRYLPLSDFFLLGGSFECYHFRFSIGFHPFGCFPSGLHPSRCLPFGFYASNSLFLDTILFGTLPLDSILPVFSLWGVRPSLYLHLITAFYFCKMGYFTKKRPVFPTKHQWKFPSLLCYNRYVGRIAKCAQQKRPH